MGKSLYDILEVSNSASPEAIRAGYERLSAQFDPYSAENQGKEAIRVRYEAVKDAFFILGNPEKRSRYDRDQAGIMDSAIAHMEVVAPFWSLPKVIVLALVLLIGGGWYYKHKEAEAALAAQRAIAEARALEAQAKAEADRAAVMQARLDAQRERDRLRQEAQTRRELEHASRSVDIERRRQESTERRAQERQAREAERKAKRLEYERQRAEAAAVAEAQRRAAREREALCRIERERYGKSISC